MPRGGLRPGAGRPKKVVETPKPAGPKKPAAPRKTAAAKSAGQELPSTNADGTKPAGGEWSPFGRQEPAAPVAEDLSTLTPLDFLLQVMRDPNEDKARRMSAAQLAAPYVHAKKGETSAKKDEAEKRKQAAQSGRFGRRAPPKLATAGGKPV